MNDGTVRDNTTGLIWLKDANCEELPLTDVEGRANFDDAQESAAMLQDGVCGLTDGSTVGDWFLPSFNQFHGFSYGCTQWTDPAMCSEDGERQWSEGDPFYGIGLRYLDEWGEEFWAGYWTSQTVSLDGPSGWVWISWDGSMGGMAKWLHCFVWPVRNP
ncbi:MAG: DUF1566 domain-containing protein, partial [Planctomycetes bacterium]|nr:DUF1566 domain-containing protein [Planctomycetota bacterium]